MIAFFSETSSTRFANYFTKGKLLFCNKLPNLNTMDMIVTARYKICVNVVDQARRKRKNGKNMQKRGKSKNKSKFKKKENRSKLRNYKAKIYAR